MKRPILVLSMAFILSCDKSLPTEVRSAAPTPAPTATPLPIPQIAGGWSGSFDGLCRLDPYRPHVTATLRQQGDVVTGSFTGDPGYAAQCSLTGDFAGHLSGNTLVGALGTAAINGSLSQGELHLHVTRGKIPGFPFPELDGDLTLRR